MKFKMGQIKKKTRDKEGRRRNEEGGIENRRKWKREKRRKKLGNKENQSVRENKIRVN